MIASRRSKLSSVGFAAARGGDISVVSHRGGDEADATAKTTPSSDAQSPRLYKQAAAALDVLLQQRDRDLLQLRQYEEAHQLPAKAEAGPSADGIVPHEL